MTDPLTRPRTQLYLITPPHIEEIILFRDTLLDALKTGGGAACLLIRQKTDGLIDLERTRALAKVLIEPLHAHNCLVLINDSVELALELGADGVHLGPSDTDAKSARQKLGPDALIGFNAGPSRHAAMLAGEAGADYVSFGPFFADAENPATLADLETLDIWQATMELPCLAWGGIRPENAEPLVRAGADFIAFQLRVAPPFERLDEIIGDFNALFDTLA